MKRIFSYIGWLLFTLFSTATFAALSLYQGETINAVWLVIAAALIFLIGYRYYSLFLAKRVMCLDSTAMTPANRFNDGLDYVPTDRFMLFGHHFAAIAGAGPLVGPVLALQMGYLPGMIWILIGAIFAGAVQDFCILVISMRRNGRSLGELIKAEMGWLPGIIAHISTFMIMIIILGVLALIVVKALTNSPWSLFTVFTTIPIGIFMGIYLRVIRPGHVLEVSIIGFTLLMFSILIGRHVATHPLLASVFTYDGKPLIWMLIAYGFFASILPVWLLLAPRDYLSTFLKIGTIIGLAISIIMVAPEVKMPAFTRFVQGDGPVWSGSLFPFLFITIACGAVSGFHSLISSGTTPKMVDNEIHTRLIGYGGMLLEAFVAVIALITASCLEPGIYFAINSPQAIIGTSLESASQTISAWGFTLTPEMLTETANNIGEMSILSRTGGAPTLAIGIAQIFSFAHKSMLAFWYHFAILFEALFILTAVDAGTRAGRFMLQDLMGTFFPALQKTDSWFGNLLATAICVGAWGYFLFQGVTDPFGGINTLWPLFGISNQMLAGIALIFVSLVLIRTKRIRYLWVTILPMFWLLICTITAGWQKVFAMNPKIGFLSHAAKIEAAIKEGNILPPAENLHQMYAIIFNDRIDATLALIFLAAVIFIFVWAFYVCFLPNKYTQSLNVQDNTGHASRNNRHTCC